MKICALCKNQTIHGDQGERMAKEGFTGCTLLPAYQFMPQDVPGACVSFNPDHAGRVVAADENGLKALIQKTNYRQ